MAQIFTRQLSAEAGVQLNPLQDNTEIPTGSKSDQNMAMVCRLLRGRIDKPFAVNRGNYTKKLGKGALIVQDERNEAYAQLVEALHNGTYNAIVQRLASNDAQINWAVSTIGRAAVLTPVVNAGVIESVTIGNGGSGYQTGQQIIFTGTNTTEAIAHVVTTNGQLQDAAVTVPGTGYRVGEEVRLTSKDGGYGAIATIDTLSGTGIATFTIDNQGKEYALDDAIVFAPVIGSGAAAAIKVTAGAVTGVTISARGSNYKVGQRVKPNAVSYPSGSGAVLTISSVNSTGGITGVTITSGGTGYNANKNGVALSGVYGTGAKGIVTNADPFGEITSVVVTNGGTGYTTVTATVDDPVSFFARKDVPNNSFLLAVKHLECHNDGIKLAWHSEEKRVNNVKVANDVITLRILDANDLVLHEFTGSLNPNAKDDYQNSIFLPNVVASQTDAVEVVCGDILAIQPNSGGYGYALGQYLWETSGILKSFDPGDEIYTTENYIAACDNLRRTPLEFGYISGGGTQSAVLISQLVELAYAVNKPVAFDIPGNLLTKEAAIAWAQANIPVVPNATHLIHAVCWRPTKDIIPSANLNGKTFIGTASLLIAYENARNAVTNANGYANKVAPVAGKDFPVNRINFTQMVELDNFDKNDLAKARITPVISETYSGGAREVFLDSLTYAPVENSLLKLRAVIDMSVDIDDRIARYSRELVQKPIEVAIDRMNNFLHKMRSDLRAAGWVTPPREASFSSLDFDYVVRKHESLVDAIVVDYYPCFVGTTRQIYLTQTLVI